MFFALGECYGCNCRREHLTFVKVHGGSVCVCVHAWADAHVTRQHSVRGSREVTFKVCAKGSFFCVINRGIRCCGETCSGSIIVAFGT